MNSYYTDITTSRVNRLLRPLRNKCNSLVALPKTVAASRVTYSKQSSTWDPESRPPLTVLYLSTGTKKLTLDSRSADEFELARRIHAVCDAFKNIAHVAFGQPCNERIPSLAAMCTLVIGKSIPCADSDSTSADSREDSTDDALDVDSIYEVVPPHYRRFLIVSHALSMILSICPPHHTLVTILLDHCLSFGLVPESTLLLNVVLAQAFLPSQLSCPPPALHPGHTNYLLDLHVKWTTRNQPSVTSSDTLLFTTSAFCQAVLNTLSHSPSSNSYILWTSKVLNRLFHVIEGRDTDSYISIIHALLRSFRETPDSSSDGENTRLATLREKLLEMMSSLFYLLFTPHDTHPPFLMSSRIHAAIDILHDCYASRLHLRISNPGSTVDLPDMIMIYTTHIFVSFRNSVKNLDRLLAILDESHPIPTTFSRLMVYLTRSHGSQPFGDCAEAFLSDLKLYSSALCSENFLRLDASWWACGLRHFETSIATAQKGDSTLATRYRKQLIEAVDIAESRCFGGLSFHASRTRHARSSGHWKWEDMVESWIQKTPIHKKRKIDGLPQSPLRSSHLFLQGSMTLSSPPSLYDRYSPTFTPSSTYSQLTDPGSCTEDGSEYREETDKENYASSPSQVVKRSQTRRVRRQSSNFRTLLADAQMNRVELHSNAGPESKPPLTVIHGKHVLPLSSRHGSHQQEQKTYYRRASLPTLSLGTIPSSDDALDLFACIPSSPAGC